ncbi:MAG TPA: GNAT family N-acetyltransferase [Burkholderiaceae bacterium]|jgi:ribosomal protein S18 acetylase RimI-like enzyme
MSVEIRVLTPAQLEAELPRLVALLKDAVESGSGLGFQAPLSDLEAREYWLSVLPELSAGSRVLLAAYAGSRVIGSGQLQLAKWSAGRHRAELQKLFVDSAHRGHGVGEALIGALHETAQRHRRSLIVLNTRCGLPAVRFYKRLGYREAGVIPGFARGPAGESHGTLILYRDLAQTATPAT